MSVSHELQWLLVRNNNSFIVKQKGLGRIFSREPSNLVQLHSEKLSGLTQKKVLSVEAAANGRGIVVSTRKTKSAPGAIKGTKNTTTVKKAGSRRAAGVVANAAAGYRSDVAKIAIARASAIVRSQRPGGRKQPPAKKTRGSGVRKVVVVEEASA